MTLIVVLAGALTIALISVLWPWAIGAAWTPTPMPTVRRMLEIARVGPVDTVYDMGCGDGRIIMAAAREFGARAVGIEVEPARFLIAWLRARWSMHRDRVTVHWGNLFTRDLARATVVTLFLTDKANDRLKNKLRSGLPPRSRVVSYLWTFEDWPPVQVDEKKKIYLYEV